MSQSLAKNLIHLTFSTKERRPYLAPAIRPEMNAYLAGILKQHDCDVIIAKSVEDHAHIFFNLSKNIALCKAVEDVKKGSSKWIKTKGPEFSTFRWQAGYGAFSVSPSSAEQVRRYIANQEQHHKRLSFQEEFRTLLSRHGIEFDERYVWD
jgi:REP element-mobilizing transposase RayT